MKILQTLRNFLFSTNADFYFICGNCGKKWDGLQSNEFVKHQMDSNHNKMEKIKK